jgi:hypothetical protein
MTAKAGGAQPPLCACIPLSPDHVGAAPAAGHDARIDDLTPDQDTYLSSWTHGT